MSELPEVVPAVPSDGEWIAKLFDSNAAILGNMSGGTLFWRWLNSGNPRDKMVVVRGRGFAHYLLRNDGVRSLYEIAVDAKSKRQGVGMALLKAVGRPVILKTDASHGESNAFYRAAGLICCGTVKAKSGKLLNVYQGW